jgi:chromosome segregation ATPase
MPSTELSVEDVESVVRKLMSLSTDNSFQRLYDIVEENERLRSTVEDLEITNRVNLSSLVKIEGELATELERTKESEEKLKNLEKEKRLLQGEVENLTGQLSSQKMSLESTERQVSTLHEELRAMESKVEQFRKLADDNEELARSASEERDKVKAERSVIQKELGDQKTKLRDLAAFKSQQLDVPQEDM